jgi:uncharacterized protein (DUF1697 family)
MSPISNKIPASSALASASPTPMVALLRGINVGGNKKMPMQELRRLAVELGFGAVSTYIQSGNLVFAGRIEPSAAERALEVAIHQHFGFAVEVVVRTAHQWQFYAARSPFRDAEQDHPNHLLLGLAKRPLKAGAATALQPYALAGERISVLKDAIWIDYPVAIAGSKLSPAVLDRAIGSTVTARNWRTVQKLAAMLRAVDSDDLGGGRSRAAPNKKAKPHARRSAASR